MCRKSAPQWGGGEGHDLSIENVLVAWTVCVNWNSLGRHPRDKVEMTQRWETKQVYDLSVKSVLFENDRDEDVCVHRRHSNRQRGNLHFYKCVHGIDHPFPHE